MKKILVGSGIFILMDQMVKGLVVHFLELSETIPILEGFFHITYVKNIGAAWSILEGGRIFLIFITLVAITAIYLIFLKGKIFTKKETLLYSLLVGGIAGNLIDRIFRGYVVDFLDFTIGKYNYPIFNLADTFIVIAAIFIIIEVIWEEKNGKNYSRKK